MISEKRDFTISDIFLSESNILKVSKPQWTTLRPLSADFRTRLSTAWSTEF